MSELTDYEKAHLVLVLAAKRLTDTEKVELVRLLYKPDPEGDKRLEEILTKLFTEALEV